MPGEIPLRHVFLCLVFASLEIGETYAEERVLRANLVSVSLAWRKIRLTGYALTQIEFSDFLFRHCFNRIVLFHFGRYRACGNAGKRGSLFLYGDNM